MERTSECRETDSRAESAESSLHSTLPQSVERPSDCRRHESSFDSPESRSHSTRLHSVGRSTECRRLDSSLESPDRTLLWCDPSFGSTLVGLMSRTRNAVHHRIKARVADFRERLLHRVPEGTLLAFAGELRTPRDLLAELDRHLEPHRAVERVQLALKSALVGRTASLPALVAYLDKLQAAFRALYDSLDPVQKEPHLRRPGGRHHIPVETKVAAKEKRRRTRVIRKTKGKRQREKIKARP